MEEKKLLKSIEDLKIGDSVWIRSDLVDGERYGHDTWVTRMKSGEIMVRRLMLEAKDIYMLGESQYSYTSEMIDWDKTNLLHELTQPERGLRANTSIIDESCDIDLTIEYDTEFVGEPKRKRGFERISDNQWATDGISTNPSWLIMPKRGTKLSAGYDIYSLRSFTLKPSESIKLPTGLKAYMEYNNVLLGIPRSSLGFKYRLQLDNTVAVIDADYYNNEKNEGHIWIKMTNDGDKDLVVKVGDAIAQLIFMRYDICDDDSFDEGEERVGGIGSTSEDEWTK